MSKKALLAEISKIDRILAKEATESEYNALNKYPHILILTSNTLQSYGFTKSQVTKIFSFAREGIAKVNNSRFIGSGDTRAIVFDDYSGTKNYNNLLTVKLYIENRIKELKRKDAKLAYNNTARNMGIQHNRINSLQGFSKDAINTTKSAEALSMDWYKSKLQKDYDAFLRKASKGTVSYTSIKLNNNSRVAGKLIIVIELQPNTDDKLVIKELDRRYSKVMRKYLAALVGVDALKSSPSIEELITSVLDRAFIGISGVLKNKPKKAVFGSYKKTAKKNVNSRLKGKIHKPIGHSLKVQQAETSPINLLALLNAGLLRKIIDNMGAGTDDSVLNYRSGRFAESAEVSSVISTRKDHITVFYNYMKYPYQTFDPGFKQYKPHRAGPSSIIDTSIRELAIGILGDRFAVTTTLQ